jgi:hypothetical protein
MPLEYLGSTQSPSIELDLEKFGPPGINGEIHVLAQLPNEHRSEAERLNDTTERQLQVFALLSKIPPGANIISSRFSERDGESYLLMSQNTAYIIVNSSQGRFTIKKNGLDELSFVTFECLSAGIAAVRETFLKGILPFLDHMSYLTNSPIFITSLWIEDQKNHHTTIYFINPYRKFLVNTHARQLIAEMSPIYAMYREAKNSHSNFYKFLCYYKILEGLLGTVRANAMKRARKLGVKPHISKALVPDSPYFQDAQRVYVGISLRDFFDNILTPRYRTAVAHFITNKGEILDMSDPTHMVSYANILLVCELCTREMITNHEGLLQQIT